MSELPIEVQQSLTSFDTTLKGIEVALAPFFADPDLRSKLPPFEAAKVNLVIAYAANTLFYMYMRTQGLNPQEHPVKKELEKIRTYIQKVRSLTDAEKERGNARSLVVNKEAANRFVKAALSNQPTSTDQAGDDLMETDEPNIPSDDDQDHMEHEANAPEDTDELSKQPTRHVEVFKKFKPLGNEALSENSPKQQRGGRSGKKASTPNSNRKRQNK